MIDCQPNYSRGFLLLQQLCSDILKTASSPELDKLNKNLQTLQAVLPRAWCIIVSSDRILSALDIGMPTSLKQGVFEEVQWQDHVAEKLNVVANEAAELEDALDVWWQDRDRLCRTGLCPDENVLRTLNVIAGEYVDYRRGKLAGQTDTELWEIEFVRDIFAIAGAMRALVHPDFLDACFAILDHEVCNPIRAVNEGLDSYKSPWELTARLKGISNALGQCLGDLQLTLSGEDLYTSLATPGAGFAVRGSLFSQVRQNSYRQLKV